jgi:hypothetical protein
MIVSLSFIGVGLIALMGKNPVRGLAIASVRILAVAYLIGEMATGAWARRERYHECLQRARMEI